MQQTRLIQVLKKLDRKAHRRFLDFVNSDYFNKNKKVRALCRYVLQYKPAFTHPKLDNELAFRVVFNDEPYNRLQFNNVVSDLFQLLLRFLGIEEARRQTGVFHALQIQALMSHDFDNLAAHELQKMQRQIESQTYRNHDYFYQKYLMHDLADQHFLRQVKREADPNLQHKSDALDRFYWINKLRIASEMVNRNTVLKAGYQPHFLDYLLTLLEDAETEVLNVPAIVVYQKVVDLVQSPDDEKAYFELKKELLTFSTAFPPKELQNLYGYALNFCIRQINFGKSQFYAEALELYKVLLADELLIQDGYLSMWTFRNIVTAGIRTGAFEWTEQFIEQKQSLLQPEDRDNAVKYNLVALAYAQKHYDVALQQLHGVEFTDNYYQIGAKTIQLKIYFELLESEALFSLAEAFRKFLNRHRQLSEYHQHSNLNFIKLSVQLYKLKTGRKHLSRKDFDKKVLNFEKQLKTLSPVTNMDWLRDQTEQANLF